MTILVVDDDTDIRLIASSALSGTGGHRVLLADSGKAALEIIDRERPDLLLTDLLMPDLCGETLLARIRERPDAVDLPVVFMTAGAEPQQVRRLVTLGARGVIRKPFNPLELAADLERLAGS